MAEPPAASIGGGRRTWLAPGGAARPWEEEFRQEAAERLVRLAGLRAGDTVVDACCGAGFASLAAAREVGPSGRVLAIDVDPDALRRARWSLRICGAGNAVAVRADSLALPLAEADAILCAFGLEYLPGIAPAIRCWSAHLKAGGTLAVALWTKPAERKGSGDANEPEIGTDLWVLERWRGLAARTELALVAHETMRAAIQQGKTAPRHDAGTEATLVRLVKIA
jgi:ubiquinone/menaquinone biosynthesis C-methylase UbiE